MNGLIKRLRYEAAISDRPGQFDRLNATADELAAALEAVKAEQAAVRAKHAAVKAMHATVRDALRKQKTGRR